MESVRSPKDRRVDQTPVPSVRIEPPACSQMRAWSGREAIRKGLAADDVGGEPVVEIRPEPLGVEREEDRRRSSRCRILGFRGVLLLVEFRNPAGVFGLLEVEEPGVQDAFRVDFAEVGFHDAGAGIELLQCGPQDAEVIGVHEVDR